MRVLHVKRQKPSASAHVPVKTCVYLRAAHLLTVYVLSAKSMPTVTRARCARTGNVFVESVAAYSVGPVPTVKSASMISKTPVIPRMAAPIVLGSASFLIVQTLWNFVNRSVGRIHLNLDEGVNGQSVSPAQHVAAMSTVPPANGAKLASASCAHALRCLNPFAVSTKTPMKMPVSRVANMSRSNMKASVELTLSSAQIPLHFVPS